MTSKQNINLQNLTQNLNQINKPKTLSKLKTILKNKKNAILQHQLKNSKLKQKK